MPNGPKEFRSTVVKPFYTEPSLTSINSDTGAGNTQLTNEINTNNIQPLFTIASPVSLAEELLEDLTSLTAFNNKLFQKSKDSNTKLQILKQNNEYFKNSRRKELDGLIDRGSFTIVHCNEAKGHRVFGSRFVDTIKNEGTSKAFPKSRLVFQAFRDKSH
eukprot:IDg22917t1